MLLNLIPCIFSGSVTFTESFVDRRVALIISIQLYFYYFFIVMCGKLFKFRIFNCVLESSIELPELPVVSLGDKGLASVISFVIENSLVSDITIDWFHHWYVDDGRVSISCGRMFGWYVLRFPNYADFKISIEQMKIVAIPNGNCDLITLRHMLLDQVVPRILSHIGKLVLHASAVEVNNRAFLFLGETGMGKSTIAVALKKHGCNLLTDDCVNVDFENGSAKCVPNYVGARLWADSVDALALDGQNLVPLNNGKKSRIYFDTEPKRFGTSVPISHIFILDSGVNISTEDSFSFKPITGPDKVIQVTRHCFPMDVTDKGALHSQFKNISLLSHASGISFFRLNLSRNYDILPDVCRGILSMNGNNNAV